MAYGIDPRLPKEINDWNSPEHWLRSDMQSALDRGELDKAKILSGAINTAAAPGIQADTDAALLEAQRIKSMPDLLKAKKETEPSPTGQGIVDQTQQALNPTSPAPNDYVSLLSKGWSLSGKNLLFK